ncbi:MAG: hypothetical protein P4L74_05885 [Candidatus Doudnabacteria bacterium]|nr:hypothetical protein [Candidatus Doudnabacteria bacterium]
MTNLQDLINLAKADGGKFFVIDDTGDAKLVIMSIEDYQHMLLGKLQRQVQDVDNVNKLITQVQLQDETPVAPLPKPSPKGPSLIHERAFPAQDLRAEVIDPSFDFEGPKVEIDDL